MSRLEELIPSLIIISIVALVFSILTLAFQLKLKSELNSVSWCVKHLQSVILPYHLIQRFIGAPFQEELVFRVPLVIFFTEFTTQAWLALIGTCLVFALLHLTNPYLSKDDWKRIENDFKEDLLESDDLKIVSKEYKTTNGEFRHKSFQIIYAFIIGILAGYFGITYHSLWLPIIVHVVGNSLGLVLVGLLLIINRFLGVK